MKNIRLIALLSILLGSVSCSEDEPANETVYTVSFNADGGSPVPAVQSVKSGEMAIAPTPNPTKAGYVFLFWSLGNATTAYRFQTPVTGHITLHAKWKSSDIPVDNIALNKTSLSMYTTDTEQLVATIAPASALAVSYSTSDKDVAIVNEEGIVKAVGAGTAVITAAAGNKSAKCTVTVDASVFVAGHYTYGSSVSKGVLWKNGKKYEMQDKFYQENYRSVFVYDGDVYVAGERRMGSGSDNPSMPALWKNGVIQPLENDAEGMAWKVFVSDGNVYVAGRENFIVANTTNLLGYRAALWKNGKIQRLTDNQSGNPDAYSVFVQGNDVYVAGTINGVKHSPAIWKNGQLQRLSDEQGDVNSIFVSGSDVYAAGSIDGGRRTSNNLPIVVPVMWKNGVLQHLDEQGYGYANSIYVSGSDVYVAGSGKLFKNGIVQVENENSSFYSVYVHNQHVYTAGSKKVGNQNAEAVLLKNNEPQELSKDGLQGYSITAYSVFVR
ncbi:MAG: InlB B-repeat-containing protein [Tannerellaceae bacterium]|jgi:uncharacterized repeat protein (TIGR02543 family)|nr:InlB B-repeat-containing protein [Tannerellaceae bacterium]